MPLPISLMQLWWRVGGDWLPGNLPRSPGEGLPSLRQPHHSNKNGSYVYQLIRTAHLDDYPISNPISRGKRIAGHFLPPPPLARPCLWVVSWGDVLEEARCRLRALSSLSFPAGKPQWDGHPLRDRRGGETAQQGPGDAGWRQ